MSFSYSFRDRDRDRPRLSDRLRGKSGDELFKELRKELDQDRKSFFDNPPSNLGSSTGSTFFRSGHLFEEPLMRGHTDIRSHLEDLAHRHPEFADQLRYPAWSSENRSNSWGRKRRGSGQQESGEASKQQPQPEPETEEQQGPLRGRAKENLSNTVPDMGQKQQQEADDKEARGQRSWSAPPDNRTQQEKPRFVSKIEITPVNPDAAPQNTHGDATKPPMAPPKPQPQPQQPKSNVRHIPIFVEGRDEPVLPKNVEPEFTQSQAPPSQNFPRPPPQFTSNQHHFRPQSPPRKQQPQQQEQAEPQEHAPVNPRDPVYRVGCVQKEVDELKAKVDAFTGTSRSDKDYILLDELLTRNLIKLDDIETEGKEEVRTARKNTIKSIQRCISVLEQKVPLPGGEKKEEAMDVEQLTPAEVNEENQQEENSSSQGENTPLEPPGNKKMNVEGQNPQDTSPPGDSQVPSSDDTVEAPKEVSSGNTDNKTA